MSTQGDKLTEIANAIRYKKGTSSAIQATQFANEIMKLGRTTPKFLSGSGKTNSSSILTITTGFEPVVIGYRYTSSSTNFCGFFTPLGKWQSTNDNDTHPYSTYTRTSTGATLEFYGKNGNRNPASTTIYWFAYGY